ncbi:hypothetical protein BDR22DRAFT_823622 [Usnea florida]
MSDYPQIPPFSPLQPDPAGNADLTGAQPATFAPAAFTARPIYPERIDYAFFDPAFRRPSLSFTLTPTRTNRGRPNNTRTTSSIEQRAGSEPTTGWCRQNTEVNTRHLSLPPALEGAPWNLRHRVSSPERLPPPIEKILETTEAEGDPILALDLANSESQRIIDREMSARIELEDEIEKLRRGNDLLTTANERLRRERDTAVRNHQVAEQRVARLQRDLARLERERLSADGNDPQQARYMEALEYERDGIQLERDHYMDLAHNRLTENQSLQDQVTALNFQLQGTRAQANPPPVDPAAIGSPDYAPPSFSPLSAVSPPGKRPRNSARGSQPPTTQQRSRIDDDVAPPTQAVRGGRGGRGRGAARGRAGRGGRGAGNVTTTRERRERACKVEKNYKV